MTQLDAKKQLFLNAVKQVSEDNSFTSTPQVVFYDEYIPNVSVNTIACIEPMSKVISVSCVHLLQMDAQSIRDTVIHEISHIYEQNHNAGFSRVNQNIRSSTWRPWSSSGLKIINGGRSLGKGDIIEEPKKKVDKTHCNYHLCRKETDTEKCKYCEFYFCVEHINPKPPSMPNFKNIKKFLSWKNADSSHPCAPYYDYLVSKEKEKGKVHRWFEKR